MQDKEGIVESLRQPMNNISLAAQVLEMYLVQQGMEDPFIEKQVETIVEQIKRLDKELLEKVWPLELEKLKK